MEARALRQLGLRKNTRTFKAYDRKLRRMVRTIPDGVRRSGRFVELKHGRRITQTPQLRAQLARSPLRPNLYTTRNRVQVSKWVRDNFNVRPLRLNRPK
jgi:hypothetical protein